MDYIERIKKLKSERKMTNDELSAITGIPLGTLSKILAGISDSPKLANIVAICEALGCSLDYAVNGIPENNNNYTLEAGEIRIIENYRKLDSHGRELVTLVLDKECERIRSADYSISAEEMTSPQQMTKKVSDKAKQAKILPSPTQRRTSQSPVVLRNGLGKRQILLYDMPASAGLGVFLDDSGADEITIPDTAKTQGADFAVKISGHSMEPKFHDGDILLVQDSETVETGELGIFVLDGAGYFKRYGGDRLISLNPEFGDILLKDFDEVACCGKVIGKLKRK